MRVLTNGHSSGTPTRRSRAEEQSAAAEDLEHGKRREEPHHDGPQADPPVEKLQPDTVSAPLELLPGRPHAAWECRYRLGRGSPDPARVPHSLPAQSQEKRNGEDRPHDVEDVAHDRTPGFRSAVPSPQNATAMSACTMAQRPDYGNWHAWARVM